MPIVIGLLIIPIILFMMMKSNSVTTKKKSKIILNISLILIALIYIIFCWVAKAEPFNFEQHYSVQYMIFRGEYILYSGLIFMFTPFMWMILFHFLRMIFRSIRIRKNAIIKRDEEYKYYRETLDKVSPSIIMFVSTFDVDMKKSISATILKLKLIGYIQEKDDSYIYTNKSTKCLLESEKMVLELIRNHNFDENRYKKVIQQEALNSKYIVKNPGGIPLRIVKILVAICVPILVCVFSIWLDDYAFENYHVYPDKNGQVYIRLGNRDDIEQLYEEVENQDHYYYRYMNDGSKTYHYDLIRADKFQYGAVRKAFLLNSFGAFIIGFIAIFVLISLYTIVEQIIYINKNYRRTIKGKNLLNKAYALKNYLKDFSLIQNRTEKELILWEYYLVYAVILDVNVMIKDKIIEKYVRDF